MFFCLSRLIASTASTTGERLKDREAALAMYPTMKPVALVADAIKDCSRRRHIILDPFAGSGTTVIAAEEIGRRARVIELDPVYCDTIIRRWQSYTDKRDRHAVTGKTFEVVDEQAGIADETSAPKLEGIRRRQKTKRHNRAGSHKHLFEYWTER